MNYRASSILFLVRSIVPTGKAMIGGGFLRDHDIGIPYKDIDVFVYARDGAEFERIVQAAEHIDGTFDLGIEVVRGFLPDESYRQWNHDVTGILTVKTHGEDVQIIGLDTEPEFTPASVYGTFDLGVCQIVYDGLKIHRSKEYEADVADKTITLLTVPRYPATGRQIMRSVARAKSLLDRFPVGWRFVLPDEKELEVDL